MLLACHGPAPCVRGASRAPAAVLRHQLKAAGPSLRRGALVGPAVSGLPAGLARPCVSTAALKDTPLQYRASDMNTILQERDACGVGFIANLKNVGSHKIVQQALEALGCMEHRGACSADDDSGDGAGLMTQIPWKLIQQDVADAQQGKHGVGMIFFPNDDELAATGKSIIEAACAEKGFTVVGWRDVPVDDDVVGRFAKVTQPRIAQVVLEPTSGSTGADLERELFLVRKEVEATKGSLGDRADDMYVNTLSSQTIVYKGMLRSAVVGTFFKDLTNEAFQTSFAIYHRRFSTNTTPKWPLAQPMRVLGHNGEINTLQGNLNWTASRQTDLRHPVWDGAEAAFLPICNDAESDSANLDHLAEVLVRTGHSPQEALAILVPEAYQNHPELEATCPEVASFYEYYEGLQEGWDGPALLVFSDGERVGARLDRNGLRPARFWQTEDDMVYVASEVGVLNDVISNAAKVIAKGRLGPGHMVLADLKAGAFKTHKDLASEIAGKHPYAEWLSTSRALADMGVSQYEQEPTMDAADALRLQAANGMGLEDSAMIVEGMAQTGGEPTYSMGDDIPLPVLSDKPHMLYSYFKQRFAQVTNPPIDPLREGLVMSLNMRLGARGNLLSPGPEAYRQVLLSTPVLLESELEALAADEGLASRRMSTTFTVGEEGGLEAAMLSLCDEVEEAVRGGCQCVVLSDRTEAMDAGTAPIPALLAMGCVHHHLIARGLRTDTSILVETAQCFSTHHVAMLVGYGAHGVCPYLALETCRQWRASPRTQSLIKSGKVPNLSVEAAQVNYKKALEKGVLKILSKMGISLLSCYQGAQIFEAYGLGEDVVELAFRGSVSRIGGMSLADLQAEAEAFWAKGFPDAAMSKLEDYGFIQSRMKGEYHSNNQTMAKLLHQAIGLKQGDGTSDPAAYDAYKAHFEESPVAVLRDCLEVDSGRAAIPLEEVESAAAIMERFCSGGMSLGAISRETHETIAIAMNRVGGKSNSGEGGEDPVRWSPVEDVEDGQSATFPYLAGLQNGDLATSRIKQVASGRFGVTPHFLVNAEQVEIKIAQGAKPGEGGQLPGQKVSPYIASLRRSKAGVPLISPPPHHDIYSIEDLAQLIFDLHQINPQAPVSVKLVSEAGIGTVASGVAKANADIIQVSGHDGGTGASPVSSIKHCGGPVEMGVAEVHQTLVDNELRGRVIVRADGGIRNGRDVVMMAAMGADEYGFGTAAMIATGCIMARVCHTNNCPVGVASQREELRARFPGTPGDVVNFLCFVAEEVRAELAALGFATMDDLIGRADVLKQRELGLAKTSGLDLSFLTRGATSAETSSSRRSQEVHSNGRTLDDDILEDEEVVAAIESQGEVSREYDIRNVDRAALGRVAGRVAAVGGDDGFTGSIRLALTGAAGQSFGAWVVGGMDVSLEGEANDYVGKGMAGGVIAIRPPAAASFDAATASIMGNTCLYGATGGKLFANGRAGERFAVRNSAVHAVVEGTGDHCCEYMTGGVVVALGSVGRNVGAGMTGGLGYFLDEGDSFPSKVNAEIVVMQRVGSAAGKAQLKGLIEEHLARTGSPKAEALLADWEASLGKFWQLVPPSEKETPEASDAPAEEMVAASA